MHVLYAMQMQMQFCGECIKVLHGSAAHVPEEAGSSVSVVEKCSVLRD